MEVFSSQGRDPLHNTKVTNKKGVRKIYDKGVRGYVIYSSTSASARLQLPKDDRKALKLSQPYFVVQVFVPVGQAFSIAMNIKDKSHTRRRLHFSSAFSDIKATPLHCQIPLISLIRGKWLNLVLNISDFVRDNFPGQAFQCVDTVEIGGISKLRKIFTLREEPNGDGDVPRHLDYPRGVDVDTQFLDSESIKDSEGVQKLREATNQIRPLTEPLVKDMAEGALAASKQDRSNGQNGPPVRIAFGTRLPAPTSSPPKSRRSMVKGLEISISDDKAPSGPPSPVVKLPTVLSPRAKTALPVSSLLDNVQGRGMNHSRKFKRTLPAPSSKKQLQGSVTDLSRNGRSNAYYDQPEREMTRESRGLGDSSELQGVTFSQSLMHSSPPQQQQKARKAYSKFRYSDYTSTSPPRPSISNQQAGPQPLEDIPLNKQHTAGSSSQLSPQNSDSSDRAFDLDSSRSNWESLFTDQSMQSPGRPAMQSRISLLPLSSQYDMFGDPGDHAKHVSFDKSPEERTPGVSASRSGHSKSDSMSSDTSERASQHLSPAGSHDQGRLGAMPALRRSVEFKDAIETPMVSPQTSDREEEETPPQVTGDLGRRAGGEEDLDYGLFNVSNNFGNRSGNGAPAPDLYACNSELLDDPVCLHEDDVDAFVGFPGKDREADEDRKRASPDLSAHAISLDPLPSRTSLPSAPRTSLVLGAERPVTSEAGERRHHVGHAKEAPTEGPDVPLGLQSVQTKAQVAQDLNPPRDGHHMTMTNHRMTYDIEHIIEKQNEYSLSYSENSLIDDLDYDSQEDLVKVEDAVKMQREMINKHRIFTPPVIPASKVVENMDAHFRPSLAAVNLPSQRSSITGGMGDHDIVKQENADDGNTMMDLIYDPILNCYYDAKANRYYELK